ncbi:BTB/POZ domain-containing protein 6-like [Mytilus californianus]|uniref:BTB/POZ domain-containing protein 6-like n=1 Tax=Mytilus californianus TaxID=6549 RepID=UPI00224724E9|nr:BTB/POZ domain-containing protein 6-like [Mytilus californianus]
MDANNATDWRDDKALPDCMMYMLQNEIMCDVTLRVGDNRTPIKAHKYMLSSRSAVFHTMFEGSLPEKGEITIPDVDEDTFRHILKYFYSDVITITNNNVKEMLYAADKYMLAAVKRECETVLKQTAKSEHATKALQTAYQYHLSELQTESLDYIEMNTKSCLLSEHAVSLSKDCLELILKSDYLNCTETDICQFIFKWGKHQCDLAKLEPSGGNMREALGNILYLIRFPNVGMEFFSKEVTSSCLLTDDEMLCIYKSHFGVVSKTFSSCLRTPVSKRKTYLVNRYSQITGPMGTSGKQSLIFLSDKDVWLKGVVIFLPHVQPATYNYDCYDQQVYQVCINISIRIMDDSNEEKFHETQQINYGPQCGHIWQMNFSKPVRVHSMRDYIIQMDDIGLQIYYGRACKESVTDLQSGVTIKFKNSKVSGDGTTVSIGQFAGLSFSV